jgi:hypothetical protein
MSFRYACDVFYASDAICDKTTGKTKTARQTALIKKSVPNFRKKLIWNSLQKEGNYLITFLLNIWFFLASCGGVLWAPRCLISNLMRLCIFNNVVSRNMQLRAAAEKAHIACVVRPLCWREGGPEGAPRGPRRGPPSKSGAGVRRPCGALLKATLHAMTCQ